jgi:hypothetical protein
MRIRKSLLQLEILAALALAVPAGGVDLSEAQMRDGLTKLAGLVAGELPKNARWVLATSQGQRFGIFTEAEDVFRTEGNTFLFDEKPGAGARLLYMSTGAVYSVKAEGAGGGDETAESQRQISATWKEANVSADVTAAVEWLLKEEKKAATAPPSEDAGPLDGGSASQNNPLLAHQQTALFWAAVLQHTGHAAEAMTLVRAALGHADEKRRKQLLDDFFNRRGNQAYQRVLQDFSRQHDWTKLRDALAALVHQFPLGWQRRDAVRVLLHHVTERTRLAAVPPLKTTRPLSAADQQRLLDWVKGLEDGKPAEHRRWTLPPLPNEGNAERADAGPSAFPREQGLAAVPLLAALLADDTLTFVGVGMNQDYGDQDFFNAEDDAITRLRSAYRSLQKPHTRAQLAWDQLSPVLPDELQRTDSENLVEVVPEVLAWYASVKNDTPGDLALAYLEAGSHGEDILAHALTLSDPKKLARMEHAMLEQANIYGLNESFTSLVEKLGPTKGAAFVASLRQKLEGDISRFSSNDQERQRKQMEAGLKRLEAAAKGEKKTPDLKSLLTLLSAYDPQAEGADQMELREALQELPKMALKLPAAERLDLILGALPGFKSPSMELYMLRFAVRERGFERDAAKPAERLALLERTRPHWQRLLAGQPGMTEDESTSMLIQTLMALELMMDHKQQSGLIEISALGPRGTRLLQEQGAALLAGQKVPPLPQAASFKSGERKQLLAEWSKKTPEEISRDLTTLDLDKLLALNDMLARDSDIPDNLKAHMALIHEVKITDVADAAAWQAWRGKTWSRDTLLALATQVSTSSGGRLAVQLQRKTPLRGFTLHIAPAKKADADWQTQFLQSASQQMGEKLPQLGKRVTVGFFEQARTNLQWIWLDAPVTETPKEAAKAANEDGESAEMLQHMREQELKTWAALSKAASETKPLPTSLYFISAPTSEFIKKD